MPRVEAHINDAVEAVAAALVRALVVVGSAAVVRRHAVRLIVLAILVRHLKWTEVFEIFAVVAAISPVHVVAARDQTKIKRCVLRAVSWFRSTYVHINKKIAQ